MHEVKTARAVHPLLRKWWMRARPIPFEISAEGEVQGAEFYCPLWAKPLDWLHAALFGSTKLEPVATPAAPKAEPIPMEITVDTSELKAALALLEQIVAEAKKANAALDAMRACSALVVAE
jgi:hypothetical protein